MLLSALPLFSLFAFFSYLALIVVVAVPIEQWRCRAAFGDGTRRGVAAFLCALGSTLFLAWSGIGVLALGSWIFYPFFGLALLLNVRRSRPDLPASLFALLVFILFLISADRFMMTYGLPGDRYSIEGVGMILRLGSIRSAKLLAAMFLLFVSLFFSFAGAYRDNAAGNVASFAFSSFLVLVFLPIETASVLGLFPPASVVLNFLLSFAAAIALQRIIRLFGAKTRSLKFFSLCAALAAAGCWLLLTSL